MVILQEATYTREIMATGCLYNQSMKAVRDITRHGGTLYVTVTDSGIDAMWTLPA